jgi:NAD+ diphosphatase
LLLGLRDGVPYFTADVSGVGPSLEGLATLTTQDTAFEEVRGLASVLPSTEAGIVAHARALIEWHRRHHYCGLCGAQTIVLKGGAIRKCLPCDTEHYPRTDPVVIMTVLHEDKCLLGRRRGRFGNFSALAGFVDQGETIEEAVRREVAEEVGLQVDAVSYIASQPWPFPSTLMMAAALTSSAPKPTWTTSRSRKPAGSAERNCARRWLVRWRASSCRVPSPLPIT